MLSGPYDEPWIILAVFVTPVVAWWLWEMVQAFRENRAARRVMRETRGDGHP